MTTPSEGEAILALANEIEKFGLREFCERRKHIKHLAGTRIVAALRAAAQTSGVRAQTIEAAGTQENETKYPFFKAALEAYFRADDIEQSRQKYQRPQP